MAYFNFINATTIDISENGNNKSNSNSVNVLVPRLLSKRLFYYHLSCTCSILSQKSDGPEI